MEAKGLLGAGTQYRQGMVGHGVKIYLVLALERRANLFSGALHPDAVLGQRKHKREHGQGGGRGLAAGVHDDVGVALHLDLGQRLVAGLLVEAQHVAHKVLAHNRLAVAADEVGLHWGVGPQIDAGFGLGVGNPPVFPKRLDGAVQV